MENKKTALITGATSGIGNELAKLMAKDGCNLVIVGRSGEELVIVANQLKKDAAATGHHIVVDYIVKDFFEPGAAEELYNEVKAKKIIIDILINDAGQGVYGKFVETDLQQELDIIQLNINTLVILTKLFLKDMVARGEGRVLQLASMFSKVSAPLMAVYAGTKAFVYNFSQSVINELKGTGVTLTALVPGPTDTDFFNKAGAEDIRIVKLGALADPEDVAKDGYKALLNGDSRVISGLPNKIMALMSNIVPDEILAEQVRKASEE